MDDDQSVVHGWYLVLGATRGKQQALYRERYGSLPQACADSSTEWGGTLVDTMLNPTTTTALYFLLPGVLLAVPLAVVLATYVLRGRLLHTVSYIGHCTTYMSYMWTWVHTYMSHMGTKGKPAKPIIDKPAKPITPTTTLVGYVPTTAERRALLAAQYRRETARALSGTWQMVQMRREGR